MPIVSTYHPPLTTRQLLVSVQNADEAALAFQCGVPWVDLKAPAAGSLGQPHPDTCSAFLEIARHNPASQISCAMGEFETVDWDWVGQWLPEFAVGKIGLAGFHCVENYITDKLAQHPGRIVPALYADWQRANAPSTDPILELTRAIKAPFLLIDTFGKDGRGLFDWFSLKILQEIQLELRSFGAGLVVAGSLRSSDWSMLEQLTDVTIGVRGAVCETTSERTSRLNPTAVQQWLEWTKKELAFGNLP